MIIKTEIVIPPRRIADLMVTAIEGGINYWCKSVKLIAGQQTSPEVKPWYDDERLYACLGGDVPLQIKVEETEPHNDKVLSYILTTGKMEQAFALMQEFGNPRGYCWRDFINENEDAITADVWFQLAVFGEVVYG